MYRRLCLYALLLIAALPMSAAKRRAVVPGTARCTFGPLAANTFPLYLTSDGQYVYWFDDADAALKRVPVGGGESEYLGTVDDALPLSIAVDEETLYLGVLPFEAIVQPVPGRILAVPKVGGTVETLISGVSGPWDLAVDATHLYWADAGTVHLFEEEIDPNGKIERASKNGSNRQTLAENLSAPLGLALDGNDVFYGETGLATGDPTVGLYRVAKSGGTIATLDDDTAVADIAIAGDSLVLWGGNATYGTALFRIHISGSDLTPLVADDGMWSPPQIFDGRAYYLTENEEGEDSIRWIDVENPVVPITVFDGIITTESFVLDDCAVTFGDGETLTIRRAPR